MYILIKPFHQRRNAVFFGSQIPCIKPFFKRIYYTNEYGIKFNKPSLHCFNKIKKLENCNYSDMIYVGDNPFKDFFNCNKAGIKTVRVMRGMYKEIKLSKFYDAKIANYYIRKINLKKNESVKN